jgi:hypothetical protein
VVKALQSVVDTATIAAAATAATAAANTITSDADAASGTAAVSLSCTIYKLIVIDLTTLSFEEQIALMSRTSVVVGMHGAGE